MQVQMRDGVQRILPHVEHQAVPALRNSLTLRYSLCQLEHVRHGRCVLWPNCARVGDVLAGHDENVSRRPWLDVPEGIGSIRRCDLLGRKFAGHDLAEDAVAHIRAAYFCAGLLPTFRKTKRLSRVGQDGANRLSKIVARDLYAIPAGLPRRQLGSTASLLT
jgi:hypothetical protein